MLRQFRVLLGSPLRRRVRTAAHQFLQESQHARQHQVATLRSILALNADSEYSRRHQLTPDLTPEEFRSRLPVSNYEQIRPYIEQLKSGNHRALLGENNQLLMFSLSSGTTHEAKYIPITRKFLNDYRRGWQIWGIQAFDAHPRIHQLDILQLASDHDQFRTPGGTPCGNISGLVGAMQNPLVRTMYVLPPCLTKITSPESRYYTAMRIALMNRHVGIVMTANPSTLIHLGQLVQNHAAQLIKDIHDGTLTTELNLPKSVKHQLFSRLRQPDRHRAYELEACLRRRGSLLPCDYWPNLQLAGVWTGGSAGAYLPSMQRYYGNIPVRDHGLSASEGRMTIPLANATPVGLLEYNTHFYEFIPESEIDSKHPHVLLAHELEVGKNYYILLTTSSGLYRYHICDVVRCGGYLGEAPMLEFLHKGAHISNLTGEKLVESQVIQAIQSTAKLLNWELPRFTLAPVWGEPPAYCLFLDEEQLPQQVEKLLQLFDLQLQQLNCEYAEKRKSGRLGKLSLHMMRAGLWNDFARDRQSRQGGSLEQYKHPCLVPNLQFLAQIQSLENRHPVFKRPHAAKHLQHAHSTIWRS